MSHTVWIAVAGEVCLPGGKRDETDTSDAHTAMREAHEELGLEPSAVQIITSMRPVLSKHFLSVYPYLPHLKHLINK